MTTKKRTAFVGLLLGLLALAGCGSDTKMPILTSGPLSTIQFGDAVNDQIVKFELTVTSITLTGSGGTANTGNLLSKPAEFEFAHSAGSLEPVSVSNVPAGTYSGATLMVSSPEVVAIVGGVATKLPATLSSSMVSVNFSPSITVGNMPLFINFDLDLANSLTLNGTPPTSATVSPKFNVSTSTIAPDQENEDDDNGEIEDVHGRVTNITAPNFTIDTGLSTITFLTDANTQFEDGIAKLADLKVGDIVEVNGVTKPDGTKLATEVERDEAEAGEEVEGIITNVTGNPATLITIAHQVDSSNSPNPPLTVDIAINANTRFRVRADKLNLSTTPAFDAGHIGKGQRVEADTGNSSSTPMVADQIKLREQALIGTVAASPAPTASGFTLNISATSAFGSLSGQISIPVAIVNGTRQKVTPTAGATLRVRGLIFFDPAATPNYSMIAARIDDNH